jgi:hypothetical protein
VQGTRHRRSVARSMLQARSPARFAWGEVVRCGPGADLVRERTRFAGEFESRMALAEQARRKVLTTTGARVLQDRCRSRGRTSGSGRTAHRR